MEAVARQPACLIGLEACSGAHEWARRFQALGHTVKLMAPRFVTPYRKNGKNDGNDAEAICEAVSRPSMRFVPIKTLEQQAVLCLHRVRQGFVEERTATINRLRGLLAEFGLVLPQKAAEVRRRATESLEQLPPRAASAVRDLREHLRVLDARVKEYERSIEAHARDHEGAKLVQQRLGIGPMTRRRSWQASATCASSRTDASSLRGSGSFLGSAPPAASSGSDTLRVAAILTCEPCWSWVPRSVLQRASSQFGSAVAVGTRTARAPRLPPRLHRRRCQKRPCRVGHAQSEREPLIARGCETQLFSDCDFKCNRSDRRSQTLLNCPSGKRRLTIEERACGLHPGPSSDAQQRPIRDLQSAFAALASLKS